MLEKLIFFLLYQWKYEIAFLKAKFLTKDASSLKKDITYVAREADKDWIFGAKVNRLSKYSNLNSQTQFRF